MILQRAMFVLTMIVLSVVSILLMLIIAGVFPVPCQEDFDFDRRFTTLLGNAELFESIERNGTSNGGNRTIHALDIFCWL